MLSAVEILAGEEADPARSSHFPEGIAATADDALERARPCQRLKDTHIEGGARREILDVDEGPRYASLLDASCVLFAHPGDLAKPNSLRGQYTPTTSRSRRAVPLASARCRLAGLRRRGASGVLYDSAHRVEPHGLAVDERCRERPAGWCTFSQELA